VRSSAHTVGLVDTSGAQLELVLLLFVGFLLMNLFKDFVKWNRGSCVYFFV